MCVFNFNHITVMTYIGGTRKSVHCIIFVSLQWRNLAIAPNWGGENNYFVAIKPVCFLRIVLGFSLVSVFEVNVWSSARSKFHLIGKQSVASLGHGFIRRYLWRASTSPKKKGIGNKKGRKWNWISIYLAYRFCNFE